MLLNRAGVEWEDNVMSIEEYKASGIKDTLEFKQLPKLVTPEGKSYY